MKTHIIVTVKYDVTDTCKLMNDADIKAYFGDTPECLPDYDMVLSMSGNFIHEVERTQMIEPNEEDL